MARFGQCLAALVGNDAPLYALQVRINVPRWSVAPGADHGGASGSQRYAGPEAADADAHGPDDCEQAEKDGEDDGDV